MRNLSSYLKIVKKEKTYFFIICSMFVIGLIFGFVFPKQGEKTFFTTNAIELFITLFTNEGNVFLYVLSQFFSNFFYLAIFTICSFSLILLPIQFLLILYKGYISGALFLALVADFGISGLILYIFAVLLQSLIICVAFSIFSTLAKFSLKNCREDSDKKTNLLIVGFVFCAMVILLSSILLFLTVSVFLKPLNFVN